MRIGSYKCKQVTRRVIIHPALRPSNILRLHKTIMDQVLLQQLEYTAPGSRPFGTSTLALFGLPGAPFEGVPVHSLLLDGSLAVWLRDAQQRALPGMDSVKVSVRILIPGYTEWTHQMRVRTGHRTTTPFTIEQAAKALATEIHRAYNHLSRQECAYSGWKLGADGITFEQIFLAGVRRVSHASIQPILVIQV